MTIALFVEHYIDTELDLLDKDSAMNAVYKTGEIQDLVDRIGDEKAVAVLEGTGTYCYLTLRAPEGARILEEFLPQFPYFSSSQTPHAD